MIDRHHFGFSNGSSAVSFCKHGQKLPDSTLDRLEHVRVLMRRRHEGSEVPGAAVPIVVAAAVMRRRKITVILSDGGSCAQKGSNDTGGQCANHGFPFSLVHFTVINSFHPWVSIA